MKIYFMQRGEAATTPSPPSDGGEGRGEEARFCFAPLLGPLHTPSSRGEEEKGHPQIFVENGRVLVIALGIAFAVLAISLPGCKSTGDKRDKETTAIGLYLEADASNAGRSKTISILRGHPTPMQIQNSSFLDERFIEKAAVVDWKESFFIQVKFDWHGTLMLDNITGANPGKRVAIEVGFDKQQRWLAAPAIQRRVSDGTLKFTPDASREEAGRIVRGLNNLAKKLTKHKKFDSPSSFSNEVAPR